MNEEFEIKSVHKVTGKGCILVTVSEFEKPIKVGDEIRLKIRGIERILPSNPNIGLVVGLKGEILHQDCN